MKSIDILERTSSLTPQPNGSEVMAPASEESSLMPVSSIGKTPNLHCLMNRMKAMAEFVLPMIWAI